MNAIAFDTLKFAKRLKEAGFTEQQAEALATAEAEFVQENLATKQDILELKRDIKEVEAALKRDIKELDVKIEQFRAELKRDIKELETSEFVKKPTALGISRSGGARNPHVFQYTLRFLRSGGTRPSFA
ncbi:MAG: hypothetical protein ACREYE_02175, partial [Gammaproteobacteria bacterium]